MSNSSHFDIEKLWEPFYVGEQSRSKELSGTGLGLPIVKALAEKYGYDYGCHRIDSRITFYITF